MDDAKLKEYLVQNDEEFRQLAERHSEFDRQLEKLISKPYLTETDQFQETILKKKKLILKDQMQLRMTRYKQEEVSP